MDLAKRAKIRSDEFYETKNCAPILTQAFQKYCNFYLSYFYTFPSVKGYGLLLSTKFLPCPDTLKYVGVRKLPIANYDILRKFQNTLYSDLFQVPQSTNEENPVSEACYLVIPLKKTRFNLKAVKIALKIIPKKSIFSKLNPKKQKFIVTSKDSPATYYYVHQLTDRTNPQNFLEKIPEKSIYSQCEPGEIQEEVLKKSEELLAEVKNLKYKEHGSVALCRKTKTARRPVGEAVKTNPNSLKLIPEEFLVIHYLSRKQFRSGPALIKNLIEVERYSYIIEFCQKYSYKGDFQTIRDATTAPIYDNLNNYDSLENLGDSILKVVSSLWAYFKFPQADQGSLTDIRTGKIKNKALALVSEKKDLLYYIRGFKLKSKAFRPAFYTNKIEPCERLLIKEKFSDGTSADVVESLIAAFFRTGGFESASLFIKQLDLLPSGWSDFRDFFGTVYRAFCRESDLRVEDFKDFSEIIPKPLCTSISLSNNYSQLESALNYTFRDRNLLVMAFTHPSVSDSNYERLEFLGDSVADIIVNSNIFNIGKFSADKLTIFRHMLVNNNILAKLSISLSLFNYLNASKELITELQKFLNSLEWEEQILEFGLYQSDPPKVLNDIFESLIGAVLIDSRSLDKTCLVFSPFFKNLVIHLVNHQEECLQNVRSRLSVFGQRTRKKIEVKNVEKNNGNFVQVFVDGVKRGESWAKTAWLARQTASKEALEWFKENFKGNSYN